MWIKTSLALSIILYGCIAWYGETHVLSTPAQARALSLGHLILLVGYLCLLRCRTQVVNFKWGVALVIIAAIAIPSFCQTDQLRYIWDGLVTVHGINPYRFAPADFAAFQGLEAMPWVRLINHAELNTIYPPIAQIFFAVSALLNPFFWHQIFDVSWFGSPSSLWQVELGWKILIGFSSAAIVWLLRRRRWDLVVFNPCYWSLIIGNGHIDGLLATLLLVALLSVRSREEPVLFSLTQAGLILTKLYPLVLTPLFLLSWWRRSNFLSVLQSSGLIFGMVFFLYAIFINGSDGKIFDSLFIYTDHWYFFGYFHRFFSDFFQILNLDNSIQWAKLLCALLGGLIYVGVFWGYVKRLYPLSRALLLVMMAYFAMNPTLHPWYLVALLPFVGLYGTKLLTPIFWPILGLASQAFYLGQQDPVYVRYWVYFCVTVFITIDLRSLRVLERR